MTRDALRRLLPAAVLLGLSACDTSRPPSTEVASAPTPAAEAAPARRANPYEGTLTALQWPGEKHLANVRQLTFGGENAEAYWSADGKKLIFQSTRPPHRCDQIFVVDVDSPGEPPPRLDRQGTDDVRLLLPGRRADPLRLDAPRGPRVPAAARHVAGLRLGALPRLRHLQRERGRLGPERLTTTPGLRRRGDGLDGRPADRLHLGQGRRPRPLLDERRRRRREAAHADARLRRRRVLQRRRGVDRLPRLAARDAEGGRGVPGAPRPAPRPAEPAGDPGHARRRLGRPAR